MGESKVPVEIAELPAVRSGTVFVCNVCPCGETQLVTTVYDELVAVLATCPHMELLIVGDEVVETRSKGVRH